MADNEMERRPRLRVTHTYVELEVSGSTYNEIFRKLKEVGYDHCFMDDGAIDMSVLAIVPENAGEWR